MGILPKRRDETPVPGKNDDGGKGGGGGRQMRGIGGDGGDEKETKGREPAGGERARVFVCACKECAWEEKKRGPRRDRDGGWGGEISRVGDGVEPVERRRAMEEGTCGAYPAQTWPRRRYLDAGRSVVQVHGGCDGGQPQRKTPVARFQQSSGRPVEACH